MKNVVMMALSSSIRAVATSSSPNSLSYKGTRMNVNVALQTPTPTKVPKLQTLLPSQANKHAPHHAWGCGCEVTTTMVNQLMILQLLMMMMAMMLRMLLRMTMMTMMTMP
jgi:hypothetical protein